ncbi:spore coat protein YlbD [Aureibacillus halotolerans]|uniref:Putative coat protein YlbD-like n=1 Tax=Aureibacillus halotolerans TaxID=1508390 RepID=A0A4R6UC18_9BACI|nr:spore coat protein YlbD [Aureibacillus halotolerans]TDQ42295.1 putative coat protein YlbD-like [Aureibacillus halotolerans]
MTSKEETIHSFKTFIKSHPGLGDEVKRKKQTWQQIFENWYLLGEDDELWASYRTTKKSASKTDYSDMMQQALSFLKNLDPDEVQKQITSVSSAIDTLQNVIKQFQSNKETSRLPVKVGGEEPFEARRFGRD